jgi:hypothetical protein
MKIASAKTKQPCYTLPLLLGVRENPKLNLLNKEQEMSLLKQGIIKDYKNSNMLFELHADSAEIYLIETEPESIMFNKFVLIWGDYVANAWDEEFDLLSTATARMATLLHVLEREPEGEIIGLKDVNEWATTWAKIVETNTDMIEGAK